MKRNGTATRAPPPTDEEPPMPKLLTPEQIEGFRRDGFLSPIPTHVRQVKVRDAGMLVRGVDEYGHFDEDPQPRNDVDEAALAAHKAASDRLLAALMEGTDAREFRA